MCIKTWPSLEEVVLSCCNPSYFQEQTVTLYNLWQYNFPFSSKISKWLAVTHGRFPCMSFLFPEKLWNTLWVTKFLFESQMSENFMNMSQTGYVIGKPHWNISQGLISQVKNKIWRLILCISLNNSHFFAPFNLNEQMSESNNLPIHLLDRQTGGYLYKNRNSVNLNHFFVLLKYFKVLSKVLKIIFWVC